MKYVKLLLTSVFFLSSLGLWSYDFSVNGKYYNITNRETNEVEITNNGNSTSMNSTYTEDLEIPKAVTRLNVTYKVTGIGAKAFRYCTKLTSVTMPNTVKYIGEAAFEYCTGLLSVSFSDSLESVGTNAFDECQSLESVVLPESVTTMGNSVFWSCSSLTSVKLPSRLKAIESRTFSSCRALKTIVIPDSVTEIKEWAFSNCSNLSSVKFPDSLRVIGRNSFWTCRSLKSVEIPKGVTSIGLRAFGNTKKLSSINVDSENEKYKSLDGVLYNKYVTELIQYPANMPELWYKIPASVKRLSSKAFYDCQNLETLIIPESIQSVDTFAIAECANLKYIFCLNEEPLSFSVEPFSGDYISDCTLFVPENSIEAYQQAEYWKEFKQVLALDDPLAVSDVKEDENESPYVYTLDGRRVLLSDIKENCIYIKDGKKYIMR